MNICFIANYDKTYLFDKIADELSKKNINVFWISVNSNLSNFLYKKYGCEKVLHINRKFIHEEPIGEYKLNEIIECDRILRHERKFAKDFLGSIQKPIYNFIKNNNISFIFGEVAGAHEILIFRMCRQNSELKCKFLNPHTIRIPNGRFAFFEDEFQTIMYKGAGSNAESTVNLEKPDYLAANSKYEKEQSGFKNELRLLMKFLLDSDYYDRYDPTKFSSKFRKLSSKIKNKINTYIYGKLNKQNFENLCNKKYVFYPLQKQPEANVDVLGRYYENQLTDICNIWRILPNDWILIVKEHPNAIGDRGWRFYKTIAKFNGVFLIDDKADSHKIISNAQAVFTVTGTAAYEAALMGIPSFTFADNFFNNLPGCYKISIEDLRKMENFEIFLKNKNFEINNEASQNTIVSKSYEGIISNPTRNPLCIEKNNVDKVSTAFLNILLDL